MNINEVRFGNAFVVPYFFEESFARQQSVATSHHVSEQLEFAGPQTDWAIAPLRSSTYQIERQRSNTQHCCIWQDSRPDQRLIVPYQFNHHDWLFREITHRREQAAHPGNHPLKYARHLRLSVCILGDRIVCAEQQTFD
jgi:hypothetical protein